MRIPLAAVPVLLFSSLPGPFFYAHALESNPAEAPQLLPSDVCASAQGRTSVCEVELDVPSACVDVSTSTSNCPVVFFLHGAGGNNNWLGRTSDVHAHGVVGVYPQGEDGWNTGPKPSNSCSWDDFECASDPDEGAFFSSIISTLRSLGAHGNVYLIGNSNGAALAHRLAANAGEDDLPIKGIVTKVTQLLARPERNGPGVLNYNRPAAGGPPVSVLNLMGVADGLIPYEGGTSSVFGTEARDDFELMSALDSMAAWAAHDGCAGSESPVITNGINCATNDDPSGTEATLYEYGGCPEGIVVEHYALHEAGHGFGAGAALDGVVVDYELAYRFIDRVEASGGGGGGGSDTRNPTASPVQSVACVDDPTWRGKFNADHDCDYVALRPDRRCGWGSVDGTKASEACRVACDACPTTTSSPVESPMTSGPTRSPTDAPTKVSSTAARTVGSAETLPRLRGSLEFWTFLRSCDGFLRPCFEPARGRCRCSEPWFRF